jgi:hypothetical protein
MADMEAPPAEPPPGDGLGTPLMDAPPPEDPPPEEETPKEKKAREKQEKKDADAKAKADAEAEKLRKKEADAQAKKDAAAKKQAEKDAKKKKKGKGKGGDDDPPPPADEAPALDELGPPPDGQGMEAPPAEDLPGLDDLAPADPPPPAGGEVPPEETPKEKKAREKREKKEAADKLKAAKQAEKDAKKKKKGKGASDDLAPPVEEAGEGPPPDLPPLEDDGLGMPPMDAPPHDSPPLHEGEHYDDGFPMDHQGGYMDEHEQWIADGGGYTNDDGEYVWNPHDTPEGYWEGEGDDAQWIPTPTAVAPEIYHQPHDPGPPAGTEAPPPEQPLPMEQPVVNKAAASNVLAHFGAPAPAPAANTLASAALAFGGGGPAAPVAEPAHYTGGHGEKVTFTEPGPIGMVLSKRASKTDGKDYMVIDKISPGKQAEKMPQLHLGLILKSVNGESVEHLSVADVSGLLQQRPVSCEFVYRTDDVSEGGDYLYGEARKGAMNIGFAARLHKKAQHAHATVDMNHQMMDHTAQDEIIDVQLNEQGPLGFRLGDHKSGIDGATYLVVTSIKPGSQAARLAPQVTEGLLLKAVNGTDVVNWATNDVMGLMASRPLQLRFVRLNDGFGGGGSGGGGGADPAVVAKLQLELAQTKEHLHAVETDGSRVLEHMYHLEDELEKSRADNTQYSSEIAVARDTVQQLDESQADLLRQLHQKQSELADEKEARERVQYENVELRKRLALLADHFETTKTQLGEQVERVTQALEMEREQHGHTRDELEMWKGQYDRAIQEHGAAIASEKFHRNQYELASKIRNATIAVTATRHAAASLGGTPRSLSVAAGGGGGGAAGGSTPRRQYASATVPAGGSMGMGMGQAAAAMGARTTSVGGTPRAPSFSAV